MDRAAREAARCALQAMADDVIVHLRAEGIGGFGPIPDLEPVRVRLSARLTASAGTYRSGGDIAISSHFVAAHGVERTRGVVLHEIAHHAVRSAHGRAAPPHGREFRDVAAALGADLRARAFAAPRRVYVYRCPACGWEWRRGRKIARGRHYSCPRCAPAYAPRYRLAYAGERSEG